jgi:hypothetical protein
LPWSKVIATAMFSTRPRISRAAARMTSARFAGAVRDQTLNPRSAAASASSRSERPTCGTVPRTLSSAGLMTGAPLADFHAPSI